VHPTGRDDEPLLICRVVPVGGLPLSGMRCVCFETHLGFNIAACIPADAQQPKQSSGVFFVIALLVRVTGKVV
jgi:hypothetical protein